MSALGVDSLNTTPIVATTWRRPTVAVVTLEGEHDMASVPQLKQALGNAAPMPPAANATMSQVRGLGRVHARTSCS